MKSNTTMGTPETINVDKTTTSASDTFIDPKHDIFNSAAKLPSITNTSGCQNKNHEKGTSDDLPLSEAEAFESILMIKDEFSEYEELMNYDEHLFNCGEPRERVSLDSQQNEKTEDLNCNSAIHQDLDLCKPYITAKGSREVFYHTFL